MSRFTAFFLIITVISGMEVIQPAAAAVLTGLTPRINLRPVGLDPFQRRQTGGVPPPSGLAPACASVCTQVISTIAANSCPPSECCTDSFETTYFDCLVCVASAADLTVYTQPQAIIDQLYDECASLGLQLSILTFPGQSPSRPLSSLEPPSPSSQTTIATITFPPLPPIIQITNFVPTSSVTQTVGPTAPATTTVSTKTPIPTSSLSSGIRSIETICFNNVASAVILGLWCYFAVQ